MTTNKPGSVNQQPLYGCTSCYEDWTWPAEDLRVFGSECWCDLCWDERRWEFPDQPSWNDLESYTPALQAECEKLKAGETSVRDALDGYDNHAEPAHEIVKSIRHRHDSFVDTICDLKARVAELEGPVAALLIGEPEYTKQGWEPGDWDIEPNATTIEAFAKLAKPGAYQLYLAPQPAERPAPDVSALVEALEEMVKWYENTSLGDNPAFQYYDLAKKALLSVAAHREGGE